MGRKRKTLPISLFGAVLAALYVNLTWLAGHQNAALAGVGVFVAIVLFGIYKYKTSDYIKKYNSVKDIQYAYDNDKRAFVKHVAHLYKRKGYITKILVPSSGSSIDIAMWDKGIEYVLAAEPMAIVPAGMIRALYLDMVDSDTDKAIFITTGTFSEEAVEYASTYGVELVDGESLIEMK